MKTIELDFFYCQHQAERMRETLRKWNGPQGLKIRKVALPCSGKLEISFLLKALESGAAGVALFGCPEEECHYMVGSTRAKNRFGYAGRILRDIGFREERIHRFVFERPPKPANMDELSEWVEKICARASQEEIIDGPA